MRKRSRPQKKKFKKSQKPNKKHKMEIITKKNGTELKHPKKMLAQSDRGIPGSSVSPRATALHRSNL